MNDTFAFEIEYGTCETRTSESSGEVQFVWKRNALGRINEGIIKSVGFLYKNEQDAKDGSAEGGTAFLVSVPAEEAIAEGIEDELPLGFCHVYVVSAAHVVRQGFTTLRINHVYGKSEIFVLPKAVQPCAEPDAWNMPEEGNDIVVYRLPIAFPNRRYNTIRLDSFATRASRPDQPHFDEAITENFKVAVGDELFMPGRLLDLKNANPPAVVRFGRLATLPTIEIGNITVYGNQESYMAELRSDSGYSGAPVLVCETPITPSAEGGSVTIRELTWLLGVNWGHLPHSDSVVAGDEKCGPLTAKTTSGIATIVSAWRLFQLLHHPELVAHRKIVWTTFKANLNSGTQGVPDFAEGQRRIL